MKNNKNDMMPEYDFSKGVRGKYSKNFSEGTNIFVLSPGVAKKTVSNSQQI